MRRSTRERNRLRGSWSSAPGVGCLKCPLGSGGKTVEVSLEDGVDQGVLRREASVGSLG